MTWTWRAVTFVIVVGLAAPAGLLAAAPAQASCVQPPLASPHRFAGTVTAVSNAGRTATVRTDDGRTVTVVGSDADGPNAATTVDRTYQVGMRYEFHPLNDTGPYRDNACTATHPIGGSAGPGGPAAPASGAGSGGLTTSVWLGISATAILVIGTGLWLLRRRSSRSAPGRRDEPNPTGA